MLTLPPRKRVFIATAPVHGGLGIEGLMRIVRERFREDPFAGDLFCFFNYRRTRVRILVWDRNGFWLLCKRLERGRFEKIDLRLPRVELDRAQLAMLLEGIDLKTLAFRQHFHRTVSIQGRGDGPESTQPA